MNQDINKNVLEFYNSIKIVSNHRYKSWEHCYNFFKNIQGCKLDKTKEELAQLHLAFYLASWGMYRGSSFILQKDYSIYNKIIKILLSDKFNILWNLDKNILVNESLIIEKFSEIYILLSNQLKEIKKEVENHPDLKSKKSHYNPDMISETLITKILLGTIGCVPAYDRYFMIGLKELNIKRQFNPRRSIKELINFYKENCKEIDNLKEKLKGHTIMKIIDMYFWKIGYDKDMKQKTIKNL